MDRRIYDRGLVTIKIAEVLPMEESQGIALKGNLINQLIIENKCNHHGTLKTNLIIPKELQRDIEPLKGKDILYIEVLATRRSKEKKLEEILYRGEILKYQLIEKGNRGYLLEIDAITLTYKMDIIRKFRTYQNKSFSLDEVLKDIKNFYPRESFLINSNLKNKKISKMIIQYGETDFEFLRRIISIYGEGIYIGGNGTIYIGEPDNENKEVVFKRSDEKFIYGIEREKHEIKRYFCYKGNNLILSGETIYIYISKEEVIKGLCHKSKISLDKNYLLVEGEIYQGNYRYPYIANEKILGASIEAIVQEVKTKENIAVMEVDLSHGLKKVAENKGISRVEKIFVEDNKKKGSFKFPYITEYSQNNSGLFCTPEKGDNIIVYFPSDEEEHGYVIGCVNSKGNGRFSNPNIRNYTLKNKENGENDFNLYINKNLLRIENTEIVIKNKKVMDIESLEEIVVKSNRNLKISSSENLKISSKNIKENYKDKNEMGETKKIKGNTIIAEFSNINTMGRIKSIKG